MKTSSAPSSAKSFFSKKTLEFIKKAGRQKNGDWLDGNREDYETLVTKPLLAFAQTLKMTLADVASGYHFPLKGIGRIKRSFSCPSPDGSVYKDWISYNITTPSASRFDSNPNIYFLLNPNDEDGDEVLIAGGLYLPSSGQLRSIREAVAADATPFKKLFGTREFKKSFPVGFSRDRTSLRIPKGFEADHPEMKWLKLQAFFVWKSYPLPVFSERDFAKTFAEDALQILHLNRLLDRAIEGKWKAPTLKAEKSLPGPLKSNKSCVNPLGYLPDF